MSCFFKNHLNPYHRGILEMAVNERRQKQNDKTGGRVITLIKKTVRPGMGGKLGGGGKTVDGNWKGGGKEQREDKEGWLAKFRTIGDKANSGGNDGKAA